MAYMQEPCPLCSRNMTAIETYPGRGELYCGHCDLTIGGNDAKTPEELIALMDGSEHRRLKAENAKLRELAKEMFYSLLNVAGGRRIMTAGETQNLIGRMSELGIEV